MFANERQNKILSIIKKNHTVTTAELMRIFNISNETARRDLSALEEKGLLSRVHGGAIALDEMMPVEDLSHRIEDNKDGKAELSETAAELINNNDIIAVDCGATTNYFAKALKKRFSKLTVITHSIDVFNILSPVDSFDVMLCGGNFLKSENAFYGQLAIDTLKKLHVQKAFICPAAISFRNGICDYNHALYQMQLHMMQCADSLYCIADSNKFEKNAMYKISDMNNSFTYITDSGLEEKHKQFYIDNNLTVITGKEDLK